MDNSIEIDGGYNKRKYILILLLDIISSDLANMVYASANDTAAISELKTQRIESTLNINYFEDTNKKNVVYFSFMHQRDLKYLFLGEINLVYERSDGSSIIQNAAKIGFISSSSTIENQLNTVINDLTNSFIKANMIIIVIVLVSVLFVTIISSRFLADFIMNDVIKLAIKMKLAQNAQAKLANRHKRNQKIEFSHTFYDINSKADTDNKNEIDILY